MEYFYVKDGKEYKFKFLKQAVNSYTNEDIYALVQKKVKNTNSQLESIDITVILTEILNNKKGRQFSYKGKIFDTAKDCYDYFNIPQEQRYTYRYHQAVKTNKQIIPLDEVIGYTASRRTVSTFEESVKKIKKWYETHEKDPNITSQNAEERQLANKIQNFRKAYKNYLLEQAGQERKTNHFISEKQIEQLNEINFMWVKKSKKEKKA